MHNPRPFRGEVDIPALKAVSLAGNAHFESLYYFQVADLVWHLRYYTRGADLAERITLWERDGQVIGYAIVVPDFHRFEWFMHPDERGTDCEFEMVAHIIQQLRALLPPHSLLRTMYVTGTDDLRQALLAEHGFHIDDSHTGLLLAHPLDSTITSPELPAGFVLRSMNGETDDARAWVKACHAAFPHEAMTLERFQHLVASPDYSPTLDTVVIAPDGQVAAFAQGWFDSDFGRIGQIEPVGTHPAFRKRGLGKAANLGALRGLQGRGAERVALHTRMSNVAARALYRSLGFVEQYQLLTYIQVDR